MLIAPPKSTVPPLALTSVLSGQWATIALFNAIELDVFAPIKDGQTTASAIAKKLKLDEKGVALILDGLVGMQVLEKKNENYSLTDVAELYLLKSSPLFLGEFFEFGRGPGAEAWKSLGEVIRTGKPKQEVNKEETAEKFFPSLAAALFPLNYTTAAMVADELKIDKLPGAPRALDVAAGSAVWSIPMAEKCSSLKVDALDFPVVLKVAERFTKKYGVQDRYQYLSGDWRGVTLEPNSYDLVILGHILHSEGLSASKTLLDKLCKAMKAGGRIVIAEFMPNEHRTGPLFPLLFAINMYLQTSDGCVFSVAELKNLLESYGFHEVKRLDLPYFKGESPVVIATKK
jgi:ubiquinone/menaquinone biosynthesis C-methylase UbiE